MPETVQEHERSEYVLKQTRLHQLKLTIPTGYHYQHSGDHGAIGLALLASGQHECLQHTKSAHSRNSTPSTSVVTSATSSPLATPPISRVQSTSNYATPALPPSYQSVSMVPPPYTQEQASSHISSAATMRMPTYMASMTR